MLVYLVNNSQHRTVAVATSYEAAKTWLETEDARPLVTTRGLYILQATSTDHQGTEEWRQVFG